ncbi:MAG: hypothetical protein ACR2MV_03395, partial [Lutimonas sp.]
MKTDPSRIGNIEKSKNNPLISQDEFVLSGFTYTKFFNNNDTNRMNNLTINNKRKVDFLRLRSSKKSYYSSQGLRILLILGLFLFSISVFAQNDGDYRSRQDGDWNNVNTWSIYDSSQPSGSEWQNATTYPGQTAGAYDVYIVGGNDILLNISVTNSIGSLTIGDDNGLLESKEEVLEIPADRYLNTNNVTIEKDGFIDWIGGGKQNHILSFPSPFILIIEDGGLLDTDDEDPNCSAGRRINIGGVDIAICNENSNAADMTFDEIINDGGYTTPVLSSDLRLEKNIDNSFAFPGANTFFTIEIFNDGPDTSVGVKVEDLLPSGYSWVSDTGAGAYVPGTGIWTVPDMASGSSETLIINVFVEFSLSPASYYINSAEVFESYNSDPDSTPNNGISSEDDQDEAGAALVFYDLGISKSVNDSNPCIGENVEFTLVVDHQAAFSVGTAAGVEVTDVLPAGFTYVSDDSGNYTPGTGVWLLSNLEPGASQTLNIVATATTAGNYTNTATITDSDGFNYNSGNNSDDVAITIGTSPNADAGATAELNCLVTSLNLAGTSSTPGATFAWTTTGTGNIVSGANTATPLVDGPGTYTLTVTDPGSGCIAIDTVIVTFLADTINPTASNPAPIDVQCAADVPAADITVVTDEADN